MLWNSTHPKESLSFDTKFGDRFEYPHHYHRDRNAGHSRVDRRRGCGIRVHARGIPAEILFLSCAEDHLKLDVI